MEKHDTFSNRMKRLKAFAGYIMINRSTYRAVVATTSQKEAAELVGVSLGYFRENWRVTKEFRDTTAAFSAPGVVYVSPNKNDLGRMLPLDEAKAAIEARLHGAGTPPATEVHTVAITFRVGETPNYSAGTETLGGTVSAVAYCDQLGRNCQAQEQIEGLETDLQDLQLELSGEQKQRLEALITKLGTIKELL